MSPTARERRRRPCACSLIVNARSAAHRRMRDVVVKPPTLARRRRSTARVGESSSSSSSGSQARMGDVPGLPVRGRTTRAAPSRTVDEVAITNRALKARLGSYRAAPSNRPGSTPRPPFRNKSSRARTRVPGSGESTPPKTEQDRSPGAGVHHGNTVVRSCKARMQATTRAVTARSV